jgi:hypothetical protein
MRETLGVFDCRSRGKALLTDHGNESAPFQGLHGSAAIRLF